MNPPKLCGCDDDSLECNAVPEFKSRREQGGITRLVGRKTVAKLVPPSVSYGVCEIQSSAGGACGWATPKGGVFTLVGLVTLPSHCSTTMKNPHLSGHLTLLWLAPRACYFGKVTKYLLDFTCRVAFGGKPGCNRVLDSNSHAPYRGSVLSKGS